MPSHEKIHGIARKFATPERIEAMTKAAYEAHRMALEHAGIRTLQPWERVGVIVQNAWREGIAAAATDLLEITLDCVDEAVRLKTSKGESSDG